MGFANSQLISVLWYKWKKGKSHRKSEMTVPLPVAFYSASKMCFDKLLGLCASQIIYFFTPYLTDEMYGPLVVACKEAVYSELCEVKL